MKKYFYASLTEAQLAVQVLSITSKPDYLQRYREDPRLPSNPNATYSADWQSWPTFLGTENKFYASLAEAQLAAQVLCITSQPDYKQRYREDPRLPSNPNATYSGDWQSWPTFLGTEKTFYTSLAEAQLAVQVLSITSQPDYLQRYREDPRLPSNPNATYSADWQSWPTFLGTENKFYASLAEAQLAAQVLSITSKPDYKQRYRRDPRLPSRPETVYSADWQSWPTFLGTENKFYTSIAEAQLAAQALSITSQPDYKQRYREDPRLPSRPETVYSVDWQSWPTFLGTENKFYTSLAEAQLAVQVLSITSKPDYLQRYREDPRLPSRPETVYSVDWQSWPTFLGTENKFYTSLAEAQLAAQVLSITSKPDYKQRYRKDPRLPSRPETVYSADWQSWPTFLGKEEKTFYTSLAEAQLAAQALSITSQPDYKQRYRRDPRLPSAPNATYSADWQSWPTFLGTENKFYASLAEAQLAAQALSITSQPDYLQRYREDPRLPSRPVTVYSADWQSWPTFLGKEEKTFYTTLAEAQLAVQALSITSQPDYKQRYREDPRLPSAPNATYSADWQSWPTFLGTENKFYASLAEAQLAAQALSITSQPDYLQRYREDPRLPSRPETVYSVDWQSWFEFLLPKQIQTLKKLKDACKILGIKNSLQYRHLQKNYAQLPSKPDKKFNNWIDWYDLLDIPKPYELHELKKIARSHQCTRSFSR
ncbi:integrase repeat-containing protein [Shewanella sp. SM32]|uniref:integrase repeat-containing protein n=1 Tax=Shewanella sp. SM32 TaxID=2912796 RepID=UPI0021D9E2E7|nr:integrase repeat-containing protein [Shewanella sp. SM32]MCU8070659.1 hypothetical protein [Shewanella sp. SM32]